MIDIKFLRENPDVVKENIKKKFQDQKLPLVDEVIELDKLLREARVKGDELRAERNSKSSEIGMLMKEKKIEEANALKAKVSEINSELESIEKEYKTEKNVKETQSKKIVLKWSNNAKITIKKE